MSRNYILAQQDYNCFRLNPQSADLVPRNYHHLKIAMFAIKPTASSMPVKIVKVGIIGYAYIIMDIILTSHGVADFA